MEEHERLKRAAQGDRTALSLLLQQHYDFVYKYLLKITLNPSLAEDLTQDTMIRCIEKINLYNGKSKFSSWLITMATRLMIDQGRRRKRHKLWQEQQQALRQMQWQAENQNEVWPDVLNALAELPEESRIPVILKHYYGYTYEEVGQILSIAEGTAKSRVHHALKQLRKELV
ncbi:RNA polymerase sigma factor SigY [Paenibacillus aceris]|uniref:RNA polymerase sigma-70 factor (ECF subfamily) n=1 Tax=Paenibacillus aceris TaxID=869555 RepID=A0ABS4HZF7_9BACL|nr:RNA polymerase sigma factor SigY [Paenibacillus aceris]MBP1964038.1 RNA polymerase sigma-70 factor (ECF subfamily) [Paenibacillus aceris]NHW34547.1 RNA polymerase sigma factor SigY [Paenibacillus aceris]